MHLLLPLQQMKVLAIIHGARRLRPSVKKLFDYYTTDTRVSFQAILTHASGHAKTIASDAKGQVELIIVYGGDGLLNEVINGLCSCSGSNPKVLVIPGGTGNDFLRNFKHSSDHNLDIVALYNSQGCVIPIPYCKTNNEKRYFINIADVGFGGHVVSALTKFRNHLGINASYILAVIRTFFSFKPVPMKLLINNHEFALPFFMIAVCHGSTFGNGMIVGPGKNPRIAQFLVVVFGKITILDYLKNFLKLKRGIRINHPGINYYETSALSILTENSALFGETDGEPLAAGSFTFGYSGQEITFLHNPFD